MSAHQQHQSSAAQQQARPAGPAGPAEEQARATGAPLPGWLPFAGGAAVVATVIALLLLLPAADQDQESMSAEQARVLQSNAAAIAGAGLQAGLVTVRDWAAVDGDGVLLNGVPVIVGAAPVPVQIGKGALVLTAKPGTVGCVTLEIRDAAGFGGTELSKPEAVGWLMLCRCTAIPTFYHAPRRCQATELQ